MDLQAFFTKHTDSELTELLADGFAQLSTRLNERTRHSPTHLDDQRTRIHRLFDTDEPVWLFFFDGGRFDIFRQLYPEYLNGDLEMVYNGGIGYTGDWFERNMRYDFGNRGLFSMMPIRFQDDVNYTGTDYFHVAPDVRADLEVSERLAHLGYKERKEGKTIEVNPLKVNAVVREYPDLDGGVIRYLKPHPPFDGLEEITSGASKTSQTMDALKDGLSYRALTEHYIQTYRTAFESAIELIPDLNGEIVITADHGECLTCGQLFHGRNHDKHDHLTHVPWFEVEGIK